MSADNNAYSFEWGVPLADSPIEQGRVALMIIDMQRGFVKRGGSVDIMLRGNRSAADYFFDRVDALVIGNCQRLLRLFRQVGAPIVFIVFGSDADDNSDLPERSRRRAAMVKNKFGVSSPPKVGSEDYSVIDELRPRADEPVLTKRSLSAFNSTNVEWQLKQRHVQSLVLVGVGTNGCVETTARDGCDLGFDCVLVHDATATFDQESHDSTMINWGRFFGAVHSTDEVVAVISDQQARKAVGA
jgi:biuret amidohydrolase